MITATLATPNFSQQFDWAVATTLVTPAFSQQLDDVIATKVTAQVDQYIDRAATHAVEDRVTQQLDNVFNSFSDIVLKQQKEVKESLQATQIMLEKSFVNTVASTQNNSFLAINAHIRATEACLAKSWDAVVDAIRSACLHTTSPQPPHSTGLGCLAVAHTMLGASKFTWKATHQKWRDNLRVNATGPNNVPNRKPQQTNGSNNPDLNAPPGRK